MLIVRLLKELGFGNSRFPLKTSKEQIRIAYRKEIRNHDFKLFKNMILPLIFSKEKANKTREMLRGNNLREIDLIYLFYLYLHPGSTTVEVAENFCKDNDYVNRIFRRLKKYVKRDRRKRTESFKLKLTKRGERIVHRNLMKIKKIVEEIKRVTQRGRGYRGAFYLFHPKRGKIVLAIKEAIEYFNL